MGGAEPGSQPGRLAPATQALADRGASDKVLHLGHSGAQSQRSQRVSLQHEPREGGVKGDEEGGPEPTGNVTWQENNGRLRTQVLWRPPHAGSACPGQAPATSAHVSLPGQGVFISRARPGAVSRWGSVEIACSHAPLPSCPPRCPGTEPHSARPGACPRGWRPAFREGWKSQLRQTPRRSPPLSAFATSFTSSPAGQGTRGHGKGLAL